MSATKREFIPILAFPVKQLPVYCSVCPLGHIRTDIDPSSYNYCSVIPRIIDTDPNTTPEWCPALAGAIPIEEYESHVGSLTNIEENEETETQMSEAKSDNNISTPRMIAKVTVNLFIGCAKYSLYIYGLSFLANSVFNAGITLSQATIYSVVLCFGTVFIMSKLCAKGKLSFNN